MTQPLDNAWWTASMQFAPGMMTIDQAAEAMRRVTTRMLLAHRLRKSPTNREWEPLWSESAGSIPGSVTHYDDQGEVIASYGPVIPSGDDREPHMIEFRAAGIDAWTACDLFDSALGQTIVTKLQQREAERMLPA